MMKKNESGYILILTLVIISLMVAMSVYIANRGGLFAPFAKMAIEREKAKLIAFGGIQVAMEQIASGSIKKEQKKESPPPTGPSGGGKKETKKKSSNVSLESDKKLLEAILPVLNKWQTFELKENIDGVDGQLKICVMCEDGKININNVYDFANKQFYKKGTTDYKKIMESVFAQLEKFTKTNLFSVFDNFLKERQYVLNDVTQLLGVKGFDIFAHSLFYEPQKEDQKKVYLTDLFTIWSDKRTIQPWLLSDSVVQLLGLKPMAISSGKKGKQKVKQLLPKMKQQADWQKDWDPTFSKLYGKKFGQLAKNITPLFATRFEPSTFSVLSYGNVGDYSVFLYAIIERQKQTKKDGVTIEVNLKKVYWL